MCRDYLSTLAVGNNTKCARIYGLEVPVYSPIREMFETKCVHKTVLYALYDSQQGVLLSVFGVVMYK